MKRYFINHISRGECIRDEEGACFPDLEAVKSEAVLSAREIMADRLLSGEDLDHSKFEVRDEENNIVFVLPFIDALPDVAP